MLEHQRRSEENVDKYPCHQHQVIIPPPSHPPPRSGQNLQRDEDPRDTDHGPQGRHNWPLDRYIVGGHWTRQRRNQAMHSSSPESSASKSLLDRSRRVRYMRVMTVLTSGRNAALKEGRVLRPFDTDGNCVKCRRNERRITLQKDKSRRKFGLLRRKLPLLHLHFLIFIVTHRRREHHGESSEGTPGRPGGLDASSAFSSPGPHPCSWLGSALRARVIRGPPQPLFATLGRAKPLKIT